MIYVRHCSTGHVCWFVKEFETDCDVTDVDVTSSCSVNQPSLHERIFTKGLSTEQMQEVCTHNQGQYSPIQIDQYFMFITWPYNYKKS